MLLRILFVKDVSFLLLAVLVVPPEHLSCLSYLCRHFAAVAQSSSANKMNAKNLAIVLTPSLFPLQVRGGTKFFTGNP